MKSKTGLLKNFKLDWIPQKYFETRCRDLVRRTDLEEEILDVMHIEGRI
jgi:hypothetical protein